MGIEVKVPEREFKEPVHRVHRDLTYKSITKELIHSDRAVACPQLTTFDITKLDSNTYQIDYIEDLGDALNFFFYKPRAPIISRVLDATGLDISDGKLFGNTKTSCSAVYGRTVTLEIRI